MAALSRRLCRSLLSKSKFSHYSASFSSGNLSSDEDLNLSESDIDSVPSSTAEFSTPSPEPASPGSSEERPVYNQPLENGLDVGIYKAILVGQVGQRPVQKKLRSGTTVTLFSLGTGGIRNNRRPLQNEDPKEYANRCAVQWHRVSVYPERLGNLAMKNVLPGSILYLEGNLETKVFTDPITGLVRRLREVAIRRNGRIVFLGNGGDEQNAMAASATEVRGAGYY
ncbi:single-stranded DNA-binding protein, mitochondrial [Euphorbia lathyris]|uniref:single-stranded DNA-binding protein, mitochondrial n=1 Tax=Euphorbia lathyris TaxID=212925 RepID=UPI0033132ECF